MPTTWPAAVVTTTRKCTVVPGFSLRSRAVTVWGPAIAGSAWTAVQRRPVDGVAELERDLSGDALRVDAREKHGAGLRHLGAAR